MNLSKTLLIISSIGFLLFLALSFYFLPKQEQANLNLPAIAGSPARLKIPKINVDAAIEYVGLTSDGAMDAPKGSANVAWFNLGQRPGEIGSAVISGHYGNWKSGEESVFEDLNKLSKGDILYIEDKKGTITTFVVRELRIYEPDADASDVFISNDGKPHLNLVTCEGDWNGNSKSYSKRLVIFADLF